MHTVRTTLLVLLSLLLAGSAHAELLGPTPYLEFGDSPFFELPFDYFYLEDFEDGSLNVPGVTSNIPRITTPSSTTDSVDIDDDSIDGFGTGGHSIFTNLKVSFLLFEFDALVLGTLPTHVGIVWTDVGPRSTSGNKPFAFEAFDPNGVSLGVLGPTLLGDDRIEGETAEDRFFGVIHADGISKVVLSSTDPNASTNWEADHLQYGAFAPPVAQCHPNVMATADANCEATVSVNNGSFKPYGTTITLDQDPPGPYPLGATDVILTVTDAVDVSDSCEASVTVLDLTPPVIACNAPAVIVPADVPISFTAAASDNCGVAQTLVTEFTCLKLTKKGKIIDMTESCVVSIAGDTITILDPKRVVIHISWVVVATDGSGNTTDVICEVEVLRPEKSKNK